MFSRLTQPAPHERLETLYNVEEELRFHIEMRILDNEAAGMSPDEAKKDALNRFGDLEAIQTECLKIDCDRQALNILGRIKSTIGLTLALGTACFTFFVLNAVFFRAPLTYKSSPGWVAMWWQHTDGYLDSHSSLDDYYSFLGNPSTFDAITAVRYKNRFVDSQTGRPIQAQGKEVTPNYFEAHQVKVFIGRSFLPADAEDVSERVVILSYAFWETRFNKAGHIVGTSITLDGIGHKIVGVAPADFRMYHKTDFFTPLRLQELTQTSDPLLLVAGLPKGKNIYKEDFPGVNLKSKASKTLVLRPVQDVYASPVKRPVLAIFIISLVLLLFSCVTFFRKQTQDVYKHAEWINQWVPTRELLFNNLATVVISGILGMLGSWALAEFLMAYILGDYTHLFDVQVDHNVVLFGVTLTFFVSFVLCIMPWIGAWLKGRQQSLNPGVRNWLGETLGKSITKRRVFRASNMLEIACALMICITASLFFREIWIEHKVDPGYDPDQVLSLSISMPEHRYKSPGKMGTFMSQLFQKVETLPGVEQASLSAFLPDEYRKYSITFSFGVKSSDPKHLIDVNLVGIDYLQIVDIPLMNGTFFSLSDLKMPRRPVILNSEIVRRYWPDRNPVGETIFLGKNRQPAEIVGVVGNVNPISSSRAVRPTIYRLIWGAACWDTNLLVKITGRQDKVAYSVKEAIWSIDREVPIYKTSWLPAVMGKRRKKQSMAMMLCLLVGLGALLVARGSIKEEVEQSIVLHLKEVGQHALAGDPKRKIRMLILRKLLSCLIPAIILGLIGAHFITQLLSSHLFTLTTWDPITSVLLLASLIVVISVTAMISSNTVLQIKPHLAIRYG